MNSDTATIKQIKQYSWIDGLLDINIKELTSNLESIKKIETKLIHKYGIPVNEAKPLENQNLKKMPHKYFGLELRKHKADIFLCRKVKRNSRTNESTSQMTDDVNYIGIAKENEYWRVDVTINGTVYTFNKISSDKEAARIYDYYVIKNAKENINKTNFRYSAETMDKIRRSMDYTIMNMF